jgi:hypothetical protein
MDDHLEKSLLFALEVEDIFLYNCYVHYDRCYNSVRISTHNENRYRTIVINPGGIHVRHI